MARVVWSREALRALDAIAAYMDEVAPSQTLPLLEGLAASARRLAVFPRMGRMVPGLDRDSLRELFVDPYRIIYEVRGDTIAVVTILHGAQDVAVRLHGLRPDLS